jgi:hypothetical protein
MKCINQDQWVSDDFENAALSVGHRRRCDKVRLLGLLEYPRQFPGTHFWGSFRARISGFHALDRGPTGYRPETPAPRVWRHRRAPHGTRPANRMDTAGVIHCAAYATRAC